MFVVEEVETFLAIVRTGSLARAARAVHASQSTVSYRLDCLEKRLGQRLVLRARGVKGVELTDAGRRYLELAERWERLVSEAARIRGHHHPKLAIGTADAISIYLLDPLIARLCEELPDLDLTVETGRGGELSERVVAGRLDVAMVFYDSVHVDLRVRELARYPMVVVFPDEAGAGATGDERHIGELVDGREIYLPWGPDFDEWRRRSTLPAPAHTVTKAHSLAAVLRTPGTWALVPTFMVGDLQARTGCAAAPVADGPPPRSVFWVERRQRRASNTTVLERLEAVAGDVFAPPAP
jgi:LysR family transcriptional regulator, transcriptional activator of the cysJI operon